MFKRRTALLSITMWGSVAALSADAQTTDDVPDWGVLAHLADTSWERTDGSRSTYAWEKRGEVLTWKFVDKGVITVVEYRRGLDGRSITRILKGSSMTWSTTFPSADSFVIVDAQGAVIAGCRLAADRSNQFCEALVDGSRTPYEWKQIPRSLFVAQFEEARAAKERFEIALKDWGEKEKAVARGIWGAFADAATSYDGKGFWWNPREYRVVNGRPGKEQYTSFMKFWWRQDPAGGMILTENQTSPDLDYYGWYEWKINQRTRGIRRTYTSRGNSEGDFSVNAQGMLEGKYTPFSGGAKRVVISQTPTGLEFIERDLAGNITWRQTMTEVAVGTYEQVYDATFARVKARKSGPGFLETLADGLAAVATATSPDYNPYADAISTPVENPLDENSAQNRQFRENLRRISEGQSRPGAPSDRPSPSGSMPSSNAPKTSGPQAQSAVGDQWWGATSSPSNSQAAGRQSTPAASSKSCYWNPKTTLEFEIHQDKVNEIEQLQLND